MNYGLFRFITHVVTWDIVSAKLINASSFFLIKCIGSVPANFLCELNISLGIFYQFIFLRLDIHEVKSLDTWEQIDRRLVSQVPSLFFVVPWKKRGLSIAFRSWKTPICCGAIIFISRCLLSIQKFRRNKFIQYFICFLIYNYHLVPILRSIIGLLSLI